MNELSKKCEVLAKAERGLERRIGIWGLYALCLGKNAVSKASRAGNADYLAEIASVEREFARNNSFALAPNRTPHSVAAGNDRG